MARNYFGAKLADARKRKGLTQDEMAEALGMTRGNYGHMENGRRKDPLTPDQAITVSRRLGLNMLELVTAMGYPVECPGLEGEKEAALILRFRTASPDLRRFLLQGLGLET